MRKEFPIHLFMQYNPETGEIGVKKDAPIEVRKRIKAIELPSEYHGKTFLYDAFEFRESGTPYKRGVFTAARIAWMLSEGEWPKGRVMMMDGNTKNIKRKNLRISDKPQPLNNKW